VVAACAGNGSIIAFMRQHATAAGHTDSSDPGEPRCPRTNAVLREPQHGVLLMGILMPCQRHHSGWPVKQ
jgi:hypothetical protein